MTHKTVTISDSIIAEHTPSTTLASPSPSVEATFFEDNPMRLKMNVHVVLRDENGLQKDERTIHNLVVDVGKAHIASILQNAAGPAQMAYMAVGTGTTAPAAGNTDLQSEITTGLGGNRITDVRSNPSAPVVRYVGTWTAGQATNGAITEAGIFNAQPVGPSSGTMLARATFSAIAKAAGDSLTITWDVTIS